MDTELLLTYLGIAAVGMFVVAYGLIIAGNLLAGISAVFLLLIVAELRRLNRLLDRRLPEKTNGEG